MQHLVLIAEAQTFFLTRSSLRLTEATKGFLILSLLDDPSLVTLGDFFPPEFTKGDNTGWVEALLP